MKTRRDHGFFLGCEYFHEICSRYIDSIGNSSIYVVLNEYIVSPYSTGFLSTFECRPAAVASGNDRNDENSVLGIDGRGSRKFPSGLPSGNIC